MFIVKCNCYALIHLPLWKILRSKDHSKKVQTVIERLTVQNTFLNPHTCANKESSSWLKKYWGQYFVDYILHPFMPSLPLVCCIFINVLQQVPININYLVCNSILKNPAQFLFNFLYICLQIIREYIVLAEVLFSLFMAKTAALDWSRSIRCL